MKHTSAFLVFFLIGISLFAQKVQVIKYPELATILEDASTDKKVINFWATWCAPCVKELPQFENLNAKYGNDKMEVILVSFDFVEQLEGKVKNFVEKKSLQSTLYLLDETDYNAFIDKIDPSWSGAIPATIMIDNRNKKRTFFEKEFKENELEKTYLEFIN